MYTPLGDLISCKIKSVEVTSEGKFAVVQAEDGDLVLYDQKGFRHADGFVGFQGDDGAFILDYVDKILMIDAASLVKTEFAEQSVIALKHKKFMGISGYSKVLYDSFGKELLSGCMDYEVYANGMYRGIDFLGMPSCGKAADALYDAYHKIVQNGVLDVIEHENGCLEVLVDKGCHLYDSKGQHIAFLDEEEALGHCLEDRCFTLVENGKEVLCLADKTKVAAGIDEVSVFANGLILTEKKNRFTEESVWCLYDGQGRLLCCSTEVISVDETYGYYVLENEDCNMVSVLKDGKEVLSNLASVLFADKLMLVERNEDEVLVYDLSLGLDKPIWQGTSSESVIFCDLEEDLERFWERNS